MRNPGGFRGVILAIWEELLAYLRLLSATLAATLSLSGPIFAQDAAGLHVGATRVDITPPASPDFPAMNDFDHEKLYLRAIVMDNGDNRAVLIGADLGGINEDVWADASQRIADELNIPVANIIMSSTHTHSDWPANATTAPGTPRYGSEFVANVSLDAVKDAMTKLKPARVGYATGEAYLNVNRDVVSRNTKRWTQAANLSAASDKTVGVLSFVGADGEPIAAYVNYAMHPVNGYLAGFVSGDFAAATSRYVEKAFGDDMVTVFTQGASGDQNPRWLRTGTNALASKGGAKITGYEMIREDIEAPLRNKTVADGPLDPVVAHQLGSYMEALGTILGEEVIRVMSDVKDLQDDPKIWGKQNTLTCPGRKRLDNAREGVAGQYEPGPDVDIRFGLLGIGNIALATTNAEIYTKIGQGVKKGSPISKTMYVTLANGRALSGYIPDDESFGHQTFQVLGTRLLPGCAEQGIVQGLSDLAAEYMAQ
ncbi:hypothetical protein D3Y55_18785 [Mesorhizobium sp. DCY119]|nr:hypothetical protein D3Y55_18785 [Mesorhizobium sp. DCY119]